MSYLNYKPSTPDPELMTAKEYPKNSVGEIAENTSLFKGVVGVVELYNVVNKGIEGVKGMVAMDKNVKAINYMGKLTDQFNRMTRAQNVVNKADFLNALEKDDGSKYKSLIYESEEYPGVISMEKYFCIKIIKNFIHSLMMRQER